MNDIFSSREFWLPWFTLETGIMEERDVAQQLRALDRDFTVRTDRLSFKEEGKKAVEQVRYAELVLPAPDGCSIQLDYMLDLGGCEKVLYLTDDDRPEPMLMGWWDLDRWHPYCLRLEELDNMLDWWDREAELDTDTPLLLLADFVGFETDAEAETLQARVNEAYQRLTEDPLPCPADIHSRAEEQYKWHEDEALGWIFHSDEYPCYSLRNPAHLDSGEGCFPFEAYNRLLPDWS